MERIFTALPLAIAAPDLEMIVGEFLPSKSSLLALFICPATKDTLICIPMVLFSHLLSFLAFLSQFCCPSFLHLF